MYIPEELKVNRFVSVAIPKPSVYFARFGSFTPADAYYTGDDQPRDLNKVDEIDDYMKYAEQMADQFDKHE